MNKHKSLALFVLLLALVQGVMAQINTQSGSWGSMGGSDWAENGSGTGSWGDLGGSGSTDNGGGIGSWGSFGNTSIDGNGNGSWGDFDMEDPYAPVGEGIVLLTLSGLGYAALKRKKSKTDSDSVLDRL